MADNKRYYYLKLKENFFDSEEIRILESMPNGIYYSNLLIKLYLKSLKFNGALKFNEYIPYDESMIATITNLNIDIVRSGLKVLASMKLIEKMDDGTIYLLNIQSFIGKSSSEADRKKLYRAKIEEEKLMLEQKSEPLGGQMSSECLAVDETALDKQLSQAETFQDKRPHSAGTFLGNRPPEIEIELDNRDKRIENREERLEYRGQNLDHRGASLDIKEKSIENIGVEGKEIGNKPFEDSGTKDEHSLSVGIIKYFEERTGTVGGLNLGAVKSAVEMHGAFYVQRAIDRALERNRPTMIYINGILKNWAKEGYPKGVEHNGTRSIIKNNGSGTNEFAGFKPPEPRILTDEERQAIEEELI